MIASLFFGYFWVNAGRPGVIHLVGFCGYIPPDVRVTEGAARSARADAQYSSPAANAGRPASGIGM
jgi:hypothetical protein